MPTGVRIHYFESDQADARIGIWINPEIRIQILDHF